MGRRRDSTRTLTPGSLVASRFRVGRCLGAGHTGAVYVATDERTGETRALKLLPTDTVAADIAQLVVAEACAAGRLGSARLVQTFDAGVLPTGESFVVMELLGGASLRELLECADAPSPEHACELLAQAAEGIEVAQGAGVQHLALTPGSLFVQSTASDSHVKVLHFGLHRLLHDVCAGVTDEPFTRAPAYRAPELLRRDQPVDARADVFALGAILFECLAGESPFEAATGEAIVRRVLNGKSSSLDMLCPELPADLILAVNRAIAHDATQRTPTAHAFVEALRPFRGSSSV